VRVIARKERPHPGAQLRLTDVDGHRVTCFATNTPGGDLAALEARHRQRARVEDRIRAAKDTGLRNLPYADFASNVMPAMAASSTARLAERREELLDALPRLDVAIYEQAGVGPCSVTPKGTSVLPVRGTSSVRVAATATARAEPTARPSVEGSSLSADRRGAPAPLRRQWR
jgi:hypothetical protein